MKNKFNRVIIMVIDGMGVGSLPDSKEYGDKNNSCLDDVLYKEGGAEIPTLLKLGLGELSCYFKEKKKYIKTSGYYSKIRMKSDFKDSWAGHWEIAGVNVPNDYSDFCNNGFSEEIIKTFELSTGLQVFGNEAIIYREEIINKLMPIHKKHKDSVIVLTEKGKETIRTFCIYALVDNINLAKQYELCEKMSEVLKSFSGIGRVGSRPIEYVNDKWIVPHSKRRDYLMFKEPEDTILTRLNESGIGVYTTGKVGAMFRNRGITEDNYARTNNEVYEQLVKYMNNVNKGLIFGTFNDMDCMYATARDSMAWKISLEDIDVKLNVFINEYMKDEDLLIICADGHGADPVYTGLHTREYSPLLVYGKKLYYSQPLCNINFMQDIANTIAENFNVSSFDTGTSFLSQLR